MPRACYDALPKLRHSRFGYDPFCWRLSATTMVANEIMYSIPSEGRRNCTSTIGREVKSPGSSSSHHEPHSALSPPPIAGRDSGMTYHQEIQPCWHLYPPRLSAIPQLGQQLKGRIQENCRRATMVCVILCPSSERTSHTRASLS